MIPADITTWQPLLLSSYNEATDQSTVLWLATVQVSPLSRSKTSSSCVHRWYYQSLVPDEQGQQVNDDSKSTANQSQWLENYPWIAKLNKSINTSCIISITRIVSLILQPGNSLIKGSAIFKVKIFNKNHLETFFN